MAERWRIAAFLAACCCTLSFRFSVDHPFPALRRRPLWASSNDFGDFKIRVGASSELNSPGSVPIIRTSMAEILRKSQKEKKIVSFKDVDEVFNEENKYAASIFTGGYFVSCEVYCCQPQTQPLVASQVANWVRAEVYALKAMGSFSAVFASVDGRRVNHMIGWMVEGSRLSASFDDFRRRGDSTDNPVALKESTHMYLPVASVPKGAKTLFDNLDVDSYPLFSIDVFTIKRQDQHGELVKALGEAIGTLEEHQQGQLPNLRAMHVLSAPDKLACIMLGVWTSAYEYEEVLSGIPEFQQAMAKVKALAIEGTMSDILDKTSPTGRMFLLNDILLP